MVNYSSWIQHSTWIFLFSAFLASCGVFQALPTPTSKPTPLPPPYSANCMPVNGKRQQACQSESTGLRYWLYLPPGETQVENLPLLLYLHGFSHSGGQLKLVLSGGPPLEIENGKKLQIAVISPQCPFGENWQSQEMVERLSQLVSEVVNLFGFDPGRVSLTGFSMGGDGAWALGIAHPKQFKALVPVASWYAKNDHICNFQDTGFASVWVFQSEKDEVVAPHYAKDLVQALELCGGNVELTLLPNADHAQTSALVYARDDLYTWLLQVSAK